MLVQEGKLACARFRPRLDDVVRDVLMLVQERRLARDSFPLWLDDVVRDVVFLVQVGKLARARFPHGWMMLFVMCSCLCKMES